MTNEKMREEFEAWAVAYFLSRNCASTIEKDLVNHEYYRFSRVDMAWVAWQASRAATPRPGAFEEYPDDNHGEYGKGWNDCHAEWEKSMGAES